MIFNPLDLNFKNPAGAIKNNSNVHFKIIIDKSLQCQNAQLIINDDSGGIFSNLNMFWCGDLENNREMWECDFSFNQIGLFWYYFKLNTKCGEKILERNEFNFARLENNKSENDIKKWQQTCYSKNFETPNWLSGGIIYQIFPDRFYNSQNSKYDVPADRILRKDWGGEPISPSEDNLFKENNDYFGGDLLGIIEKLPYLKSLGVSAIYLNPIFLAHSNHRYNTADYSKIDPLLGTETDFKNLCSFAVKFDIKIILDGVFSHTGSDSIYFNKENRYKTIGAYNSKDSKYLNWYKFSNWPNEYKCWWDFKTLPEIDENNEEYCEFITGENGIIAKWLNLGAKGWRLDVADELPDEFISKIRKRMKSIDKDSILFGEVWEDASNKESYNQRRRYFLGDELDSVTNYPFRNAIIEFLINKNSDYLYKTILEIMNNYPREVIPNLMNILGTHDTERILTVISDHYKIDAINILKLAVAIQFTLPGIPCIFYGDEAGLTGKKDPYCRKCFPWGQENKDILRFYKSLGKFRKSSQSLKNGNFSPLFFGSKIFAFKRETEKEILFCIFNLKDEAFKFQLEENFKNIKTFPENIENQNNKIIIPSKNFALIKYWPTK